MTQPAVWIEWLRAVEAEPLGKVSDDGAGHDVTDRRG